MKQFAPRDSSKYCQECYSLSHEASYEDAIVQEEVILSICSNRYSKHHLKGLVREVQPLTE